MEYSIIVNDVSKSFRGEMVLKNVSVKCRPGHIYGFVGKNGSGRPFCSRLSVVLSIRIPVRWKSRARSWERRLTSRRAWA